MTLLTEHSTASFWLWCVQRLLLPWRCSVAGLHRVSAWGFKWAFAITVTAALAACGPGTGGTGIGPVVGTYISLTGTATGGASTTPGTVPPGVASAGYVLVLEPTTIRLTGACLAFQFDGAWVEANGEIRVTGSYRQAAPANDLALAPALPGTLVAKLESTGLTVTLQDARGAVALSFATGAKLADGAGTVTAPACKSLPAGSAP